MHNNEKLSLLHPGCCNCCNGTDPGTSGLQLVQTPDLHAPLLDCVPVYHVYSLQRQDKIATFGVSILWPQHSTLRAGVEEVFEYVLFLRSCPKPTNLSIMIGRLN